MKNLSGGKDSRVGWEEEALKAEKRESNVSSAGHISISSHINISGHYNKYWMLTSDRNNRVSKKERMKS